MDKTSADLSLELDEKDKEIAEAIRVKEEVHQAILNLRRQKIELDVALSKAKYNYDTWKIERTQIASAFWHAKNQGLWKKPPYATKPISSSKTISEPSTKANFAGYAEKSRLPADTTLSTRASLCLADTIYQTLFQFAGIATNMHTLGKTYFQRRWQQNMGKRGLMTMKIGGMKKQNSQASG
jgi:hypothetical protein